MKISFNEKNEAERFLLISIIGLTEALLEKSITIRDSENALFSPYSLSILRQEEIGKSIIKLVEAGCELEDIASLLPDRLEHEIMRIKEQALNELVELPDERNAYTIEKWIDKP